MKNLISIALLFALLASAANAAVAMTDGDPAVKNLNSVPDAGYTMVVLSGGVVTACTEHGHDGTVCVRL